MPLKELVADRSSALLRRISDGIALGAGKDNHLPMHPDWQDHRERSWIDFPLTGSFWDEMGAVSKVELELTTTGAGVHVARGSSPSFWIYRAVENVSPNGSSMDSGSATTAPVVYPGPEARSGDGVRVTYSGSGGEVVLTPDITDMAREWMPTRLGGRGGSCYGVRLDQGDNSSDGAEVWSAEGTPSKRPRLRVTYTAKSAMVPRAPSLVVPAGVKVRTTQFDLTCADAMTSYDLQVSTDPKFATATHWNLVTSTAGLAGDGKSVSVAYGGAALWPLTVTYWWRARGRNVNGIGAWAAPVSFTSDPAAVPADQLDRWAQTILAELSQPRRQVLLGQLIPEGEQVAQLVGTDFGQRWRVTDANHGPTIDRVIELVGMTLSVDASGWYADVVTHDLGEASELVTMEGDI